MNTPDPFSGISLTVETPDLMAFSCGCTLKTHIRGGVPTAVMQPCKPECPVGQYMIQASVEQGHEIEIWTAQ